MRPHLCLAFFTVLAACGSDKPAETPVSAPAASGSPLERYFPLEEGKIYDYTTNEGGDVGMLVMRVHRVDATHGELRSSNASKRFVYAPDGVAYDGGAYILKAPIAVGNAWPGEHGGTTRIVTKDASPKLTANAYTGCIQTVEEGGRPAGARYQTTYCPDVGMVLLEVSAQGAEARAELKSYAFPITVQ
ncbi:MAG TPA: hypothetical protein VIF62_28080 [Labilithrix sp.]